MMTLKIIEEWRPVPGYEGRYEVSNTGRVRSLDRKEMCNGKERPRKGRELAHIKKRGYSLVKLCKDGNVRAVGIHRIVASAFLPNPAALPEVNHKDENRSNNLVSNLEWCDRAYNAKYGTAPTRIANKLHKPVISTDSKGNETFYKSVTDAAVAFGGAPGNICNAISGYSKSAWGLKWRYADA